MTKKNLKNFMKQQNVIRTFAKKVVKAVDLFSTFMEERQNTWPGLLNEC